MKGSRRFPAFFILKTLNFSLCFFSTFWFAIMSLSIQTSRVKAVGHANLTSAQLNVSNFYIKGLLLMHPVYSNSLNGISKFNYLISLLSFYMFGGRVYFWLEKLIDATHHENGKLVKKGGAKVSFYFRLQFCPSFYK